MSTITVEPSIYQGAVQYARQHNVSVEKMVEDYLLRFQMLAVPQTQEKKKYHISPRIKAMSTGFRAPASLSYDYKEEIRDAISNKYL